jgi:spore coat protein CotF
MRIDNNLNSMIASELQINDMATNIARVANTVADPEFQEVSADLIDSIVGQIPEIISYSANAKSIETQNAVSDMLLNIKA